MYWFALALNYKDFKRVAKNKFYWKLPSEQEIIIFDDENIDILKKIFAKQDYFILPTRLNKIKVIYICKEIYFSFIFFRIRLN